MFFVELLWNKCPGNGLCTGCGRMPLRTSLAIHFNLSIISFICPSCISFRSCSMPANLPICSPLLIPWVMNVLRRRNVLSHTTRTPMAIPSSQVTNTSSRTMSTAFPFFEANE